MRNRHRLRLRERKPRSVCRLKRNGVFFRGAPARHLRIRRKPAWPCGPDPGALPDFGKVCEDPHVFRWKQGRPLICCCRVMSATRRAAERIAGSHFFASCLNAGRRRERAWPGVVGTAQPRPETCDACDGGTLRGSRRTFGGRPPRDRRSGTTAGHPSNGGWFGIAAPKGTERRMVKHLEPLVASMT